MPLAALVVPGSLSTRTGGYIYDQHVVDGLRARGWRVTVHELAGDFPPVSARDHQEAAAAFSAIASDTIVLVDELIFSTIPAIVGLEAARLRLVPIIHLPLAENVGLDPDEASRLEALERQALRAAARVIATAPSSASTLVEYGVSPERIVLAQPGTDPRPLAHGSSGDTIELLCAATIEPRKGHPILLRSLAALPARDWHLTCAGSLTRHPAAVAVVRGLLRELRLEDHVSLRGELDADEMERCYNEADLFVLPTFKETYGMAVAEALAFGVPVISTTTGAIPDLVGDDAGLLASPGDEVGFASAVARVVGDAALRHRLQAGARAARSRIPAWDITLDRIVAGLEPLRNLTPEA